MFGKKKKRVKLLEDQLVKNYLELHSATEYEETRWFIVKARYKELKALGIDRYFPAPGEPDLSDVFEPEG